MNNRIGSQIARQVFVNTIEVESMNIVADNTNCCADNKKIINFPINVRTLLEVGYRYGLKYCPRSRRFR